MRRAVLDANVWVSAYMYPMSIPGQAAHLVRMKTIESAISLPLIDQVLRALTRLRTFEITIEEARLDLIDLSVLVQPDFRLSVITAKESDNRVLECAVAGNADVIVTGDHKHLLRLGQYEGIPIISPREFVDTFR